MRARLHIRRPITLLVSCVIPVVVFFALVGIPVISGGSAPPLASAATTPAQKIGMKVLLITDTTSQPSYGDWQNTLKREGVPFDSVVTNPANVSPAPADGATPLPVLSSTAADGTPVANYEAVIVAFSGTQGLSSAQWSTLQTFEQQFSVRQLSAYVFPSSDYGLSAVTGGADASGTTVNLTTDGASVFPYLKPGASLKLDTGTFGYQSTPLTAATTPALPAGASVDTLVSGPGSSSLVGIYTTADGRQTMYQTFDQNQFMLQSELLRHGELAWLTRNTYFGDQRNYLETHIDDNFLSDDSWSVAGNATTPAHSTDFNAADALREVPADVTTAATWSAANHFRIDMLFNGAGSGAADPLLTAFQATKNDFGWVNHTWDHPNIDEGCASQNYIEAEINQNTNWAASSAGLGLTQSTNPTVALGNENPGALVTGEHSGAANLVPGNPGQVDPPSLDAATPAATGGTLVAGNYVYAVTDQFNTAAPGETPVAGTGESAGSVSAAVPVTGTTGSVALTWSAVCHAAGYKIYRAPDTGTIGPWSLIGTVAANTATDFTDPTSTTDTSGGGPIQKTFLDTGTAGTAATPPSTGSATESPYEQNPVLNAAFAGTLGGGIKYFGADASKPYPSPADGAFATGAFSGAQSPAGATFTDAGATAIPRYPTNIYYNVSTNAQEIDEYETLYDSPGPAGTPGPGNCQPVTNVTSCNPAGTTFTIDQIVASVDQGMFQHLMGNDPRPSYFHQTNLMSQSTGAVNGQGTGLFYETLNPLLAQYNAYFASNAPIEQLTMAQVGTLLTEQAGWAAANATQVSGNIQGNVVTVSNSGTAAVELPLTGTNIGSAYGGSTSGWTLAPSGTSTYTALAAWPAPPTVPVLVTPPTGPAPSTGTAPLPGPAPKPATPPTTPAPRKRVVKKSAPAMLVAVQVAPKTVHIKRGSQVTVSLKCQAPKGKVCSGRFKLKADGQTVSHTFRIKAGQVGRIVIGLPKKARAVFATRGPKQPAHSAARKPASHTLRATLSISTQQSIGRAHVTTGKLTIKS
jgi:hypothetical protein